VLDIERWSVAWMASTAKAVAVIDVFILFLCHQILTSYGSAR
jgi:hypothetical protein